MRANDNYSSRLVIESWQSLLDSQLADDGRRYYIYTDRKASIREQRETHA